MGKILLSLLFFNLTFSAFSQDKKPNIIFILTDDHRWDALGFAGNTMIRTPEMDRMAKEGIYYENAFVTTPICAASRASTAPAAAAVVAAPRSAARLKRRS